MQFENYKISLLDSSQFNKFFALVDKNRVRLEDFFAGTVSKMKTLSEAIKYCETIEEKIEDRSYFPFMIEDVTTHAYIGLIDVKNIDWDVPKAELGAFINTEYENKGIISKATILVVDHLVDSYQFKKLLCRAHSSNLGSIQVIKKCGFEFEGCIRNDYRTTSGKLVDLNYYGRIF